MAFRLQLLGPPELLRPDGSPVSLSLGKPLALLTYVACHPDGVLRDDLGSLFWPAAPRGKARHSVRQAIWVLKNACGEELFDGEDPLKLRPGILETDLDAFREALSCGDIPGARELWRGPFLDTFYLAGCRPWDHWVEELRADLDRRFHKALLLSATEHRQEGRPEDALDELDLALRVNPASWAAHAGRVELLLELLRLDEAREALVDAHHQVGDQPEVREPLQALEEKLAEAARMQRAQLRETEGFPLEFVGRSRELALLRTLWREAQTGRASVAVITGPAGIGKTRIGREFRASLIAEDASWAEVRGSRVEMKLRWGAVAALVKQLLLLPGSAGISSASDGLLRAMIPSLGRGVVNLQTVNGVSPPALLDAVSDLLAAVSFETPLLVTLDDFQWFDGESRTLLVSVMRRIRELRVLFLVQGRSDLSSRSWEAQERELQEEAGATRILLSPLEEEEVQELLGLVAEFPDPKDLSRVTRQIHRATGGNPLFIRSVLQELSEQGILVEDEGEWAFHSRELPLEFHFPDNVRTLLRDRLDRLSERAGALAGALAARGRGTSLATLQRITGMDDGESSRAVAELLEREIVVWANDATLDFSHDLMRQAALARFPAPRGTGRSPWARWPGEHKSLAAAAMVAAITLPLGIFWGRSLRSVEPAAVPYGGGTVYLTLMEGRAAVLPGPGDPSTWEFIPELSSPDSGYGRPIRGPGDTLAWIGNKDAEEGPDLIRFLSDGSQLPLLSAPGDQTSEGVSPEGGRLLYLSENVGDETFSRSLYSYSFVDGSTRLVLRGTGRLANSSWSRNGDMISAVITSVPDTLRVITQQGKDLAAWTFPTVQQSTWCGQDLLAAVSDGRTTFLVRVHPPATPVDTITQLELGRALACSPDGRAVAYLAIMDGRVQAVLRDLQSGEVRPLPSGGNTVSQIGWVPDHTTPVPTEVCAGRETFQVSWGEKAPLPATLVLSDGSTSEEGIWWESLDPAVATVNQGNELVGNGVGSTDLVVHWGYSLTDTIQVQVLDRGKGGAFRRERFARIDTAFWTPVGDPTPIVTEFEGDSVLLLRGDDKYTDGLVSKVPLSMEQGITLELEFRLTLTRNVHQNVFLCLNDVDPGGYSRITGAATSIHNGICFRYPSEEFERMDPSEAYFEVLSGLKHTVSLPDVFPSPGWTHIGIQVRADGQAFLVVNRRIVARSAVRIETEPQGQWSLVLAGNAIEANPMIRNLTIWQEARYAEPVSLGGGPGG